MPPPRSYSRRLLPCSPLPPTALLTADRRDRTRASCQIPLVSLFNFPLLSLYPPWIHGRPPLSHSHAEDAWHSPYCHTFSSILKFILHSLVVLHTNGVVRYIYFEESLVVYWS
jgi:hypothetical protein